MKLSRTEQQQDRGFDEGRKTLMGRIVKLNQVTNAQIGLFGRYKGRTFVFEPSVGFFAHTFGVKIPADQLGHMPVDVDHQFGRNMPADVDHRVGRNLPSIKIHRFGRNLPSIKIPEDVGRDMPSIDHWFGPNLESRQPGRHPIDPSKPASCAMTKTATTQRIEIRSLLN